jgi:lipopolysaccharide transport system permease protein
MRPMVRNLRETYQYRGLLLSLVQRELKARYRGSVLGFFWTFLNPTLQMLVYALVFGVFLQNRIAAYPFFMFVGLLPWIWFTSSVLGGASAISDRRDLLTKVRFPAQVLPTAVVATNFMNFVFSLPLMVALGLVFGHVPSWHVVAFPVVVLVQLCFTLGLVYIVAALNVTFRDLQHIVQNVLTMWFFATPVLYQLSSMSEANQRLISIANPMAVLMNSYQAIFYEHRLPPALPLALLMAGSLVLLWAASMLFESRREEFAETV